MTVNEAITSLRNRGFAVADLSDAAITAILADAATFAEYTRYRPLHALLTFETVADQQVYTWTEMGDANGLWAHKIIWNPYTTGDEWDLAQTLAIYGVPREAGYWHLPSLDVLEQIKSAAWANSYQGSGYQIDNAGGSVYLTPVPQSAGQTVCVLYTKKVAAVTDVPAVDVDILIDYLEWMCSLRMAKELAEKSQAVRIKTPEYERSVGEQIGVWRANGKESRNRFISKCQVGAAAARS